MSSRQDENWRATASTNNQARRRQKRQPAPSPAVIRLRTDLDPNENHPLSQLDARLRDERRQQVFAEILARLANGPAKNVDSGSIPKSDGDSIKNQELS